MAKEAQKRETFESILDRPSKEAKRPKPLPVGHYICTVRGLPREDVSTQKGTPYMEFTLQPIEAMEDVSEHDLAEMGGIKARTIRYTLWLTDDAEWRLAKFLDDCGIPQEDDDDEPLSHSQRIAEINGAQVKVHLKHTPSPDGVMYANVSTTMPVEE